MDDPIFGPIINVPNYDEFTWRFLSEWGIIRVLSTINDNDEEENDHNYELYDYENKLTILHNALVGISWSDFLAFGQAHYGTDLFIYFKGMDYIFRMQVTISTRANEQQIFYYNYPITIVFENVTSVDEWNRMLQVLINDINQYIEESTNIYRSKQVKIIRIDAQLYINNTILINDDYVRSFPNKAPQSTTVSRIKRLEVLKMLGLKRSDFVNFNAYKESKHELDDESRFMEVSDINIEKKDAIQDNAQIIPDSVTVESVEDDFFTVIRGSEKKPKKLEDNPNPNAFRSNLEYNPNPNDIKINSNTNFKNLHLNEDDFSASFDNAKKLEDNHSNNLKNQIFKDLKNNQKNYFKMYDYPHDPDIIKNNPYSHKYLSYLESLDSESLQNAINKIHNAETEEIDIFLGIKHAKESDIKNKKIFNINKVSSDYRKQQNLKADIEDEIREKIKQETYLNNIIREAREQNERARAEKERVEKERMEKDIDNNYDFLDGWISKYKNHPKKDNDREGGIGKWRPLPDKVESLKFIFNPKQTLKNEDYCFLGCTVAHLNNVTNAHLLNKMLNDVVDGKDDRLIDVESVKKKVTYDEIKEFADKNNISYIIWILLVTESSFSIVKRLEIIVSDSKHKIFLLQFEDHFSLINDVDAFVRFSHSKEHKYFVCHLCYDVTFRSESKLSEHISNCRSSRGGKTYKLLDNSKTVMRFKNRKNRMMHNYVVYADIESILYKSNEIKASTKLTSHHKPVMVGCFTPNNRLDKYRYNFFKGETCIFSFLSYITKLSNVVRKSVNKSYIKTFKTKSELNKCFLCDSLIEYGIDCILICNGYGMIANNVYLHEDCFIKFTPSRELVVIFHNLKGYDAHFLVDEFSALCKNFFSIPKTKEKYTFFSGEINDVRIKFIDSYAFLQDSLKKLAEGLDKNKLRFMRGSDWDNFPVDVLGLKIPFPYEYIDSLEKLDCQNFPENEIDWYSNLTKSKPSFDKINQARNIFNLMKCKTIGEYMEVYLKIDVYILAEIFEAFRERVLNDYLIDPCHYFTTPGLAWDCAFSFITKENPKFGLELLNREDLISFFIEYGVIRGGISSVSSEKYCDELGENESIEYLDVTNLYGYAMTFPLPYGDFEFLECENTLETALEIIHEWSDDCEYGFILEIDAYVDPTYHDKYNDLPLLPSVHNHKLSPNFYIKKNYKTHICLLQQAYRFGGLKITNVSRILKFKQACWLKGYIEFNTHKRSVSVNKSDKDFYKLMNNSVYGKTMENVLKRSKFKFYSKNDREKMLKDYHNYNLKYFSEFTSNIFISEETGCPFFDKPIYVGFVVLEYSKRHMYFLLYDFIKPRLNMTLMYMDTDSFIIHAKEKINWENFKEWFDLSSIGINNNKGRLGTLKNEFPSKKIEKFYALCSKTYMVIFKKTLFFNLAIIKNKGCNNRGVSEKDFINALKEPGFIVEKEMASIRSYKHEVFTTLQTKKTISYKDDDKRFSYNSNKNTYARGHLGTMVEIIERRFRLTYFNNIKD